MFSIQIDDESAFIQVIKQQLTSFALHFRISIVTHRYKTRRYPLTQSINHYLNTFHLLLLRYHHYIIKYSIP